MTEPMRTPDGSHIAWDEAGAGESVLLLHGIAADRRTWDAQVTALAGAGYRVLRFDLRGSGESTSAVEGYALPEYLADLEQFVGERGLERFHLAGHSLGGMLAQRFTLSHPRRVRSLAVVSSTSHNGRRATAFNTLMVSFATHGFERIMADSALRQDAEAVLAEAFPAGMKLELLARGMEQPNPTLAACWRACIGFSTKDELDQIACPVLVAHGTGDRLIPISAGRAIHRAIPGSTWLEVESGHALPRQRARELNDAMLTLLCR